MNAALTPDDIPSFLNDLAQRFEPEGELVNILSPTVKMLLFHDSLARREGLGGADQGWRNVMSGLEALVSIKPIAIMLTQMEEWNPQAATAPDFETQSLMGPLLRLSTFGFEWVSETESGVLLRN